MRVLVRPSVAGRAIVSVVARIASIGIEVVAMIATGSSVRGQIVSVSAVARGRSRYGMRMAGKI